MTSNDSDLVLQCEGCNHIWVVDIPFPIQLSALIKLLERASKFCPQCGLDGTQRQGKSIRVVSDQPLRNVLHFISQKVQKEPLP